MNKPNIKLCKDCANYSYSTMGMDRCNTGKISLVNGQPIFKFCSTERGGSSSSGYCGAKGSRWIPKVPAEVEVKAPSFSLNFSDVNMLEVRPIKSTNCFCKFCAKPIPKGELASVFDTIIAGDRVSIHFHIDCVGTFAAKTVNQYLDIKNAESKTT